MRRTIGVVVVAMLVCAVDEAQARGSGGGALPGASTAQMSQCVSPDPDRAIIGCSAIITSSGAPDIMSMAYANRGLAHEKRGEHEMAVADMNAAVRADAKNPDVYNARGNFYLFGNDFMNAIADYNQAIALNPRYAAAYTNRGEAHRLQGEDDAAIADYEQSIKLNGRAAPTFVDRGLALEDKGDWTRAIADFTQAIKLDSKYLPAYDERAQAYEKSGDHAHALADIAQAVKLDPKNADQHRLP